ncbi:MAG TPA: carboxypeptidase regulatory-like domain-containing protein [Bryobacteraceae bacterium]|nr:carboxypeptidase regulatory-like domain-containing protein [Bryobacteraceae bacterium]
MKLRGLFRLIAGFCFFLTALLAQNTGSLKGQLTDSSGAAIPGATVTITAGATTKTASTGADGTFTVNGLAPGSYTVTANAFGFQPLPKTAQVGAGKTVRLAFPMQLAAAKQEVTVQEQTTGALSVEASQNAGQLTLSQTDLDALPDDPDDLQADLEALAGPAAGPNGPQFFIDGFTGGRMPPKDSIREIRINQNPFSAEFNQVGFGRIEILTKPGSDKYHGMALFADSDSALNSRNPYVTNKPDFFSRQEDANFSGPLNKRASFFLDFERRNIQDNAIVNATLLDDNFNPYNLQQSFLVPNTRTEFGPRIDYQLNGSNTLSLRYYYMRSDEQNAGIGGTQFLNLPSQGYSYRNDENSAVITETAVINSKVVNEVRARYMKYVTKDFAANTGSAVDVLSEFNGGGAQIGRTVDAEARWELQNFTTWTAGSHAFKAGFRVRQWQEGLISPQNFGGTYTFSGRLAPILDANNQPVGNPADCMNLQQGALAPSDCTSISALEQYRRTLMFQGAGLPAQTIQLLGGMPSQFTIAAGNPLTHLSMTDVGIYLQDDWRVKQNLTVNLGIRYENQTDIRDWRDVAPRLGFAWSPGKKNKTVIRGGFGIFYDRIPDTLLLNALKLNGTNQLQYTVANPLFFQTAPPPVSTLGTASNPTIQELVRDIRAPYLMQTAFGVERQLPGNTTVALNYANSHGVHELLDNNINAPLPGTYTGAADSGVRPYGTQNNLYAYQSVGMFNQNQLIVSVNSRLNSAMSIFSYYTLNYAKSTSDGSASFPSNPYDIATDYGRSAMDVRHRFALGGSVVTKFNLRFSPFISARSGMPFNITTGQDLNGDSIFNDRPAFAPNANCADTNDYACTPYGNFLLHPGPNSQTIPRNYATGPSYFAINLRMSRTWGFGAETGGTSSNGGGHRAPVGGGFGGTRAMRGGFHGGFGDTSTGRKYNLTLWIETRNLTNTVDPAVPIGILESSRFGESNGLAGGYGPSGGTANNRRVTLGVRFSF